MTIRKSMFDSSHPPVREADIWRRRGRDDPPPQRRPSRPLLPCFVRPILMLAWVCTHTHTHTRHTLVRRLSIPPLCSTPFCCHSSYGVSTVSTKRLKIVVNTSRDHLLTLHFATLDCTTLPYPTILHIYIYVCMHVYMYIYIYIHIHINI